MRKPAPGNRLVVGDSGLVFELPDAVASGLVGNKSARYVDEAVAAPVVPPRPVPDGPEPDDDQQLEPAQPKRRGRPPKVVAEESTGQ